MATHTDRVAPTGEHYDEGHSSKITFEDDPNLTFWETVVGAPGIDGGDPVPTTTMFNETYRTKAPRKLKEFTPFQVQGKFASGTIDEVFALINENQWITITWPDGAQFTFPGGLKSFQPAQAQEGNPLEGTLEIVPTSQIDGEEEDHEVKAPSTGT